jgi:hypothetical protein
MTLRPATQTDLGASPVVIRPTVESDDAAVARLVALDSARPLRGEVLVAVVEDEPWAVLALDDGRVAADPFRPSAIAVELLRLRARHLRAATRERRGARRALRIPRRASAWMKA